MHTVINMITSFHRCTVDHYTAFKRWAPITLWCDAVSQTNGHGV